MHLRAVIDLGTNTFHLLIVRIREDHSFEEIYRERIFVKLAEEGIDHIGKAAFDRGMQAVRHFDRMIKSHNAFQIRAFGTAALRTASNGNDFIHCVREETGIVVSLIDGLEEARLIHLGVSQAVPFGAEMQLLMDIGGGSVEFILANQSGVKWVGSFMVGVGILFNRFHRHDPINKNEIEQIQVFLDLELAPLMIACHSYQPIVLTGASGAFDTVLAMMPFEQRSPVFAVLQMEHFPALHERLLRSTIEQRRLMPEIPEERLEMIVVAMILIEYILRKTGISVMHISSYALKEGMVVDDDW